MQSSPRHQHRFDAKQFPFSLYRLSDREYDFLEERSFKIRYDSMFIFHLECHRRNPPDEFMLGQALLALEYEFGESSGYLDSFKQTFCFPLLLKIEKPNGIFYYLLKIADCRGGIDFILYRPIDRIDYTSKQDLYISHQPIENELSQSEIEYFITYIWGYLSGFSRHIDRWLPDIKSFFRQIDASHIIYGYWHGKFVEEEIDTPDEYERKVRELNAKYGRSEKSDVEKVTEVCQLIQSVEQSGTEN